MAESLLRVEDLVLRFGGVTATDHVSLNVFSGELHAIIGPNGAGKTTLISQLTGQLTPDSGTIRFAGQDITRLPAHRRSRLGLARSFQITSLLPDFTAADNVAMAAQAHDGHSFRFWGNARKEKGLRDAAHAALSRVGLEHRVHVVLDQHDGDFAPQLLQQRHHLRRFGGAQARHRFVEQQQFWFCRERDRELKFALLAMAQFRHHGVGAVFEPDP